MTPLSQKPIAVTSLKTGDVFGKKQIEGIGMILFDQTNFMILDSMDANIRPENENDLNRTKFEKTFAKELNWKGTVSLKEAIEIYSQKTSEVIFCAYDVTPNWILLSEAYTMAGVEYNMSSTDIL